jgi:phospholipid N-methyltransferase
MPSSRFLAKKMLKNIDFNKAKVIVEYGAGNGVITKHILNNMRDDAILLCFEINKNFYDHLKEIDDDRLILLDVSAEHIIDILHEKDIKDVDYFISSLPLSIIPQKIGKKILNNSKKALKDNGIFIQYQYSLSFYKILKDVFEDKNVNLHYEILNIPPAFIYKCRKRNQ